ncbi:hypothetical protein E5D57_009953 [Metarhizium anisopliae]|nr:hypothetical protein E5D57_009953 [Metarhizium anisopliae]
MQIPPFPPTDAAEMRVLPKASLAKKPSAAPARVDPPILIHPPKLKGKSQPCLSCCCVVPAPLGQSAAGGGGKTHDTGGTTPALRQ